MSRVGDREQGIGNRKRRSLFSVPYPPFPVTGNVSPVICSLLCLCFSLGLCAQGREQPRSTQGEEFFIISSVNSSKQQLVLKRPTEVTLLVRVNEKTAYLDQQGRPLQLKDFRAGDTVYVGSRSSAEGPPLVTRIRKGLMTLEELRHRYLRSGD